jgi:uncharacterized damage-inducible protein DinB
VGEISNYRGELVSRLRAVTDDIAWAARGLNDAEAHYRPASDEWTIHEHLSHLADMEREVYLPLLRWATVPDMLDPLDYSRRDWHETRYRPDESAARVVEDLGRMRDEELLIFRQMGDTAWTRYRTDTRWGPLSCQWLAELMYRHALDHLQGLMALKQDLHLAALTPPPVVVGGYIGGRA